MNQLPEPTIRIAIADDQNLFRQALASLISGLPSFVLAMEAANGQELLTLLEQAPILPDIALIDMDMPGMNGVDLNIELQKRHPAIRVIVLSVHDNPRIIARMIEAGADAYLVKNCDREELTTAIRIVYTTGFYINHRALLAIQQSAAYKNKPIKNINGIPLSITNRESEIMQLICQEFNSSEIAARLNLSLRTVEGHRNNLMNKIGCRNIAGLVLFAVKYGLFIV